MTHALKLCNLVGSVRRCHNKWTAIFSPEPSSTPTVKPHALLHSLCTVLSTRLPHVLLIVFLFISFRSPHGKGEHDSGPCQDLMSKAPSEMQNAFKYWSRYLRMYAPQSNPEEFALVGASGVFRCTMYRFSSRVKCGAST